MRIAYISYEHPSGFSSGGIGTYTDQIAQLMALRGHDIEVFSAGVEGETGDKHSAYQLHLIQTLSREDFRTAVFTVFNAAHKQKPFDLIEGPEFGADALIIKRELPSLPLIVKLHTPRFLVDRLNCIRPSVISKLRFLFGGLARGRYQVPYWRKYSGYDPERDVYELADGLSSPSASLATIVQAEWGVAAITILENPGPGTVCKPAIDQGCATPFNILFIGRLERRKGVYDIAKAIPLIIKKNPDVVFRFAGSDQPCRKPGSTTKGYLMENIIPRKARVEFLGLLTAEELKGKLEEADICLFPSLWENFPNVCLEAMFAAKAIIASDQGGMAEMITHLKDGYLVPPNNPTAIAKAVVLLAADPVLRKQLGKAARLTIERRYADAIIGEKTELFYQETINHLA